EWTFYQNQPPEISCPRYFSKALKSVQTAEIEVNWTSPRDLHLTIEGGKTLDWEISLASTAVSRLMNLMGSIMPDALWHNHAVLKAMGAFAGNALRAGHLGLTGKVPNGQNYIANPLLIWIIKNGSARYKGKELGAPGPVPEQTKLGDFWIPQRGILAIGRAFFEPFNPQLHKAVSN
ncbi:MAG: hypothetical protein WAN36_08895, partial [Calditrichia bacterium]